MTIDEQLREWMKGNPIHNHEREECCPDFSCCRPELLQPLEVRKAFCDVCEIGDEGAKSKYLAMFLGAAIQSYKPNKKIHIISGEREVEH